MKHVITFLCLAAALAAYIAGSMSGAAIFFGAGIIFEGMFWFRLFRRKRNS